MLKFAIVVSQFNPNATHGLLQGARSFLLEKGIELSDRDVFEAPGSFEIPLIAQKLAKSGRYSGVICLGCVIKGETAHFEFISLGTTLGIMQGMLSSEVPITFGILTTYDEEQAFLRSGGHGDNKGREAAAACLQTAQLLEKISKL